MSGKESRPTLFQLSVRGVAILIVTLLGLQAMRAMQELFDPPRPATFQESENGVKEGPARSLMAQANQLKVGKEQLEEGYWRFLDFDWDVTQFVLADRALDLLIQSPPRPVVTDAKQRLVDDQLKLLKLLEWNLLSKRVGDGWTNYWLQDDMLSLRIGLVDAAPAEIVFALRQDDGHWTTFVGRPQPQGVRSLRGTTNHLLPLPVHCQTIMQRYAVSDDRVTLQMLVGRFQPSELLQSWRSSGWQVRKTFAVADSRTLDQLCISGDKIVRAWAPLEERSAKILLLMEVPDVARKP